MISGRRYWKMNRGIPTKITMECRMSMSSLRLVHILPLQHLHVQDGSRFESPCATEHVLGILRHDSETRDVTIPFSIHCFLCKTNEYTHHQAKVANKIHGCSAFVLFQTKKVAHHLSWETGWKIQVTFLILRFLSFSANCVLNQDGRSSVVFFKYSYLHTCFELQCTVTWWKKYCTS